jgi:error-prone DNA polymerase
VWDLVRFCREQNILVQGRGSAANSAVCYSLGITAVDPVSMELLFERFLSEERGEWPDIDLDLPSGDEREKVIQHVYRQLWRARRGHDGECHHLPQPDGGTRNGQGARDLTRKRSPRFPPRLRPGNFATKTTRSTAASAMPGSTSSILACASITSSALAVQDMPRHLGQHSGGMVICQGQLDSVVPLEPASMPGRVVVQWDKEDCADMGIIKVDLLGLGMMAVLKDSIELIRNHYRRRSQFGASSAGRS